jgi:hypothetical protein
MKKPGSFPLTAPEIAQAKAFAALGYSDRRIGRELRKSAHTVKKALVSPEAIAEVQTIKANLVDLFDDVALRMLKSITDDDIKKLSAYQRTISGAIAVDKSRLLKGESTANVSVHVLVDVLHAIRAKAREEYESTAPDAPPELPA